MVFLRAEPAHFLRKIFQLICFFAIHFTASSIMSTIQLHDGTWHLEENPDFEAPYRPLREFSDVAAGLVLWQKLGNLFGEFDFCVAVVKICMPRILMMMIIITNYQ